MGVYSDAQSKGCDVFTFRDDLIAVKDSYRKQPTYQTASRMRSRQTFLHRAWRSVPQTGAQRAVRLAEAEARGDIHQCSGSWKRPRSGAPPALGLVSGACRRLRATLGHRDTRSRSHSCPQRKSRWGNRASPWRGRNPVRVETAAVSGTKGGRSRDLMEGESPGQIGRAHV